MNEAESTGLEVITSALAGMAQPVQTSFFKAVSELLGGLTAIPAAKLKQYAQGIEDTTAARSAIAAMVAKAAGDGGLTDPLLMQAAAEVYLPGVLKKAKNRILVAQRAAENIAEQVNEHANAAPPEDDWMNFFTRFAEDASSENLQDLFGRILAGQIVRPGSFSQRTVRAVAELDQTIATEFSMVWAESVGDAVNFSSKYSRGEGFSLWKRLAEVGLMAPSQILQYLPPYSPVLNGNAFWAPISAGGSTLLVQFPEGCGARWEHIELTRVGREIGSILPRPNYEANMREVGVTLSQQGVARVELHSPEKPTELIYQAPPKI